MGDPLPLGYLVLTHLERVRQGYLCLGLRVSAAAYLALG